MSTLTRCFAVLSLAVAVPAAADPRSSTDAVVTADRDFTIDLAHRIAPDGNAVVSPASIQLALAMTYAGARGKTAAELARALHLDRAGDVHAAFAALSTALASLDHDDQSFHIANRLFGDRSFRWSQAYLDLTSKDYGAALEPLDFRGDADAARVHINEWVESVTGKKIVDLLPAGSVGSDTRMVLADAIYFKGAWMTPFDPHATKLARFFVSGKTGAEVPTMAQTEHLRFGGGDGAHILELPYSGGDVAMDIILPDDRNGLAKVEARLDGADLAKLVGSLHEERVDVALPKFHVRTATRMKAVLEQLGIRALFTDKADLSGMAGDGARKLQVDEVFHQAFVTVDERGTEAAAATAVVAREGAIMIDRKPVVFHADHPFAWCIRDTRTGEILFYGRVVDPR